MKNVLKLISAFSFHSSYYSGLKVLGSVPLVSRHFTYDPKKIFHDPEMNELEKRLIDILPDTAELSMFAEGKGLLVDKTPMLRRFIEDHSKFFLCVRPRRMGKTLTLDMIQSIYEKKIELFSGTSLEKDKEFWDKIIPYPVVRLEPPKGLYHKNVDGKMTLWYNIFQGIANKYGCSIEKSTPESLLRNLLDHVAITSGKGKCIFLLDEYDRPFLDCIENNCDLKTIEEVRSSISDTYSAIKSSAKNIHKCFITGVSKFAGLSVYSGLNNLLDISENPLYSGLIGLTESEIRKNSNIQDYLKFIAVKASKESGKKKTPEEVLCELMNFYDGYRFSPDSDIKIINPYSFLKFLQNARGPLPISKDGSLIMESYWYTTGSSSHIIRNIGKLKKSDIEMIAQDKIKIKKLEIDNSCTPEMYKDNLILQLYHNGYLTIEKLELGRSEEESEYLLKFPNKEVKEAFCNEAFETWKIKTYQNILNSIRTEKFEKTIEAITLLFVMKKGLTHKNEFNFQQQLCSFISKHSEKNEASATEKTLLPTRKRPDILWTCKGKNNKAWINIFEIKMSTNPKKSTAIDRKYIESIMMDEEATKWLNELEGTTRNYRTFDLEFDETNLSKMIVHECSENETKPKQVFEHPKPVKP